MNEPKAAFDEIDDDTEARAVAEAEAEIEGGKGAPHAKSVGVAVEARQRRSNAASVQIIWSPAAVREIDQIYRCIAQFNASAAEHVVMDLLAAADSLASPIAAGRLLAQACANSSSPIATFCVIGSPPIMSEFHAYATPHAARRSPEYAV